MKKYLLLLFVQIGLISPVRSQSPQQVLQWMNTVKADDHNFYYEIPFEYRNGSIVIKVTIGQNTYDYIFDTGGYNDITDEIQAKNNFPVLTTQVVGSANRLKARVNMVKVDSLKIGPLLFRNVAALQMNFHPSPTITCTINGALIGASIIKKYAWQIDYTRKKIVVTDQVNKLPGLDHAIKIPVTFNSRLMPYIVARVDGHKEKFMLDFGSGSLFTLTEKDGEKYSAGKQIFEIDGASSEGGNGVVEQTLHMIKADSLEIGSARFKNCPVYYLQSANESLVGNPIIKNYVVTLNFPDNELYLSPIVASSPKEGLETFGFSLKYSDGKVITGTLYKGLAAEQAGLQVGDQVVAVDGKPLAYADACSAIAPLADLLISKTTVVLTVQKDGKPTAITINKAKVF
jgi:predicted aspartyl protease